MSYDACARPGCQSAAGQKRANFAVLRNPDVPSVLVETAFISNPDEERKLRSEAYQNDLANALISGIQKYFAANPPSLAGFATRATAR